ncbi:MAG: hypothetical protein Q8O37_15110 [Sulfuricellaceae bacterium]|nr:hypothetical protein [Sulfuricellaceae bacterium]
MGGVELQAIQVKFDRAPGVALDQVAEIVGQLGFGEVVDLVGEVSAQAPDGAGVGVDGLGLQPLELEVLEMGLVLPVEVLGRGWWSCWFILTKYCTIKPLSNEGMKVQNMSCGSVRRLLRVAASSNPALKRDAAKARRPLAPLGIRAHLTILR